MAWYARQEVRKYKFHWDHLTVFLHTAVTIIQIGVWIHIWNCLYDLFTAPVRRAAAVLAKTHIQLLRRSR